MMLKNSPLNLPPLAEDVLMNAKISKKLRNYLNSSQTNKGHILKSMRSENASTVDSRHKIISRLSLNYAGDPNKNSLTKLNDDVQQLMQRKISLMEELYDMDRAQNRDKSPNPITGDNIFSNANISPLTGSVGNIRPGNFKHNLSTPDDLMMSSKRETDKSYNDSKLKPKVSQYRVSTVGKYSNRK